MTSSTKIRTYQDRLRIFAIIYLFSEETQDPPDPSLKRVLKSEVKIQKIDFLLRNPDYLAFEILNYAEKNESEKEDIKKIVKSIFKKNEPSIRKVQMKRFFHGAYEDIDDVIAFLISIGFIDFSSKKRTDLNTFEKYYYVTELAEEKVKANLSSFEYLKWYFDRCELIKKYFGDRSGNLLKQAQYEIPEYRNTSLKDYIQGIEDKAKDKFQLLYGEYL